MSGPLLSVQELSVSFATRRGPVRALEGVSFELAPGEILGLIGASGSGKTITALAIMGLLDPAARITGGRVLFDGQDLLAKGPRARAEWRGRQAGMVFQNPRAALNPIRTVGAQIADVVARHHPGTSREVRAQALAALRQMRIPDPERRLGAFPHQLSGGMCQRVGLALALAGCPRLLLADEPTTGLDVTTQAAIMELVRELARSRGLAVLLITHDLPLAAQNCDRLAVLHAGRLVEIAPPAALLAHPRHPNTAALVRASPAFAVRLEDLQPDLEATSDPARCAHGAADPPSFVDPPADWRAPPDPMCPADHSTACIGKSSQPARARSAAERGETISEGHDVPAATSELAVGAPTRSRQCAHLRDGELAGFSATLAGIDAAPAPALLEAQGLSHLFVLPHHTPFARAPRLHAVDGVDLRIAPGEAVGLVGESGCGKSTLARLVARLLDPTAGALYFEGARISDLPATRFAHSPERRAIQMVFQDPGGSLNPRFTAFQAIADPLRVLEPRIDRAALRARVEATARAVGLAGELLQRLPHQLSGGQQARVGIARALVVEPRLIVLDEPTAGLDAPVQAMVLQLLDRLRRERGIALLVVSHDLHVVRLLCTRTLVMYQGQVVESGPTARLWQHPAHPYTRALLAALPRLRGPTPPPIRLQGEPQSPIAPPQARCRLAGRCPAEQPLCTRRAPQLRPLDPGHQVRCHFPELD